MNTIWIAICYSTTSKDVVVVLQTTAAIIWAQYGIVSHVNL